MRIAGSNTRISFAEQKRRIAAFRQSRRNPQCHGGAEPRSIPLIFGNNEKRPASLCRRSFPFIQLGPSNWPGFLRSSGACQRPEQTSPEIIPLDIPAQEGPGEGQQRNQKPVGVAAEDLPAIRLEGDLNQIDQRLGDQKIEKPQIKFRFLMQF